MMPRFSRRNIRPVNSIKHVVDTQLGLTAGTQLIINQARSRDAPVLGNPAEVETGSTINSIYLKVEGYVNDSTPVTLSNLYMVLFKNPGSALVLPNANAVGVSDLKKYAIHQEMVMLQQVSFGNPRVVFQGVIKIPRGYRRNGPDDALALALFAPGNDTFICVQCIYKEYR